MTDRNLTSARSRLARLAGALAIGTALIGGGTLLLVGDRMTLPFQEVRKDAVPKSFEKPR